jgi:transcriptional regulator with AAA-type ATPase domain/NAD-dependent dihydropyrimidine dehydrogenase PreA subunit
MVSASLITWLSERTPLGVLGENALEAIATHLQEQTLPDHYTLAQENTPAAGLYILASGYLESRCKTLPDCCFLPGSVINLKDILLKQNATATITTLGKAQVWFMEAATVLSLAQQHAEIPQILSEILAQQVAQLSLQLTWEQERQTLLRPYLVTRAKRGIIGTSRYAERLRSQIKEASRQPNPVLIFGEPGLEKDNIAALIHFGSDLRHEPVIKIDSSKISPSGVDLFGRVGGKKGLIEAVDQGTIIFNNIQDLPSTLFPALTELITTNTYTPLDNHNPETPPKQINHARLIFISEKTLPNLDPAIKYFIKVPPLRVRKTDLEEQANYYLSLLCRAKNQDKPTVSPEALRRLQAYDFPNNLRELQSLLERAITQLDNRQVITEEIIWPEQGKKQLFRVNLLNVYPWLRKFLRSDWWPNRINYSFTAGFFLIINLILFLAPQARQENFALNLFWAWWWPLILIGFAFVGRLWCAVCPFMIYGEITQKLSLWLWPRQLKKWPRQSAEKWGGWFLYGLFALILLWEELWNLENTAYLSSCLLLLITAGAMIFSSIFERRFWCRYLCPIGGMNGLFAKLSLTELRAQQGTCSAECSTYQCYKGGPEKGEGLETEGCPLYSHPAQLEDNRDCVLCMTCLKACPHRSVELNLRPLAIELWTTHVPRSYEVALLLLLLGAVFLHHLGEINLQLGLNLDLTNFWLHSLISVLALFLPALLPLAGQQLIKNLATKPRAFVELAYGYLPLVWLANLAHYLRLGLGEAGKILPVSMATFGLRVEGLPILVAHPAVISFLQGVSLIFGALISLWLTQKMGRQPLKVLWPQHLVTLILTWSLWQLILGAS